MDLLGKMNGTKVFIKAARACWELLGSETAVPSRWAMPGHNSGYTYFRKGLPTYISSAQTQAILFGFDEK